MESIFPPLLIFINKLKIALNRNNEQRSYLIHDVNQGQSQKQYTTQIHDSLGNQEYACCTEGCALPYILLQESTIHLLFVWWVLHYHVSPAEPQYMSIILEGEDGLSHHPLKELHSTPVLYIFLGDREDRQIIRHLATGTPQKSQYVGRAIHCHAPCHRVPTACSIGWMFEC